MSVPDSAIFWVLAGVFVTVHLLAIVRRRIYWPFCDWPMFSSPPSLPRCDAFRIRLQLSDRTEWWRPHYYYRARNFSHIVQIMLGRVRAGEVPFPQVARNMSRSAVILVYSDCPGVDPRQIRRIEIVKVTATLGDDGQRFAMEEKLVLGFEPPPPEVVAMEATR